MSEEEHLFYFSSKYSLQDPITGSFTINLPLTLNLEGKWKCAVLDFFIRPDNLDFFIRPDDSNKHTSEFIYILADFCSTSFIQENKQIPILKKIGVNKGTYHYSFTHPLYIPLKQPTLTNFDLTFLDTFFEPITLHKTFLIECTLHFSKNGR